MIDIAGLTIKKVRVSLDRGDFSVKELAEAYLENINKTNSNLNVYLETYDDVLKEAEKLDEQKNIEKKMLHGIPISLKDNILVNGKTATAASKILKGYVAPYDATVVAKLKSEQAFFLGRTNMDEFAMGGSTENSAFGVTKNPLDPTRVSGGSSGGGAASIASNTALVALGSDTGGSVREPSSFCGIVGLKPTYGSVSRHGLMAMGSSLDVIGPMTKTVSDCEIVFNVIKGRDVLDSTTYGNDLYEKPKGGKKIGVPYHVLENGGISPIAKKNFEQSVQKLKDLGFEIQDIVLPNISSSLAVYYILMPAEVSSNLARFDGVKYGLHVDGGDNLLADYLQTRREGFGPEVRRRILIGTYVLSAGYHDAYYNKALMLRQKISADFAEAFGKVDAIITPTTAGPAFKIGEKIKDPLSLYLEDMFTVPANIVGIPAISVPNGFVETDGLKLPLGLQIMAPHDHESTLFSIGKKFLGE